MIGFPNAKINIGLNIITKLPNGYHELKSLMIPTGFCDILEFIPSEIDSLELSGIPIPGEKKENLLWKVLSLLREKNDIPPVKIHLHKAIPAGAGLGGGSADASFFINLLDVFFGLNLPVEEKEITAAKIGTDCPFFIRNKPAIIRGTGTTMEAFDLDLKNLYLVILFPSFSISTAKAYAGVSPGPEKVSLEKLLINNINKWRNSIENDFERSLFTEYPTLSDLKEELYSCGALYASLSGSGSAIYGIFNKKPTLPDKLKEVLVYEDWM